MSFMDPAAFATAISAAKKGCAQCGGPIRIPPSGDPFSSGGWRGRYLCADCWTLWWDEHPEDLADGASREYVSGQARHIRLRRGSELLFEENESRVFLTERGTLLFALKAQDGCAPDEFDPARFDLLLRALRAVDTKGVSGYCFPGIPAAAGETA